MDDNKKQAAPPVTPPPVGDTGVTPPPPPIDQPADTGTPPPPPTGTGAGDISDVKLPGEEDKQPDAAAIPTVGSMPGKKPAAPIVGPTEEKPEETKAA